MSNTVVTAKTRGINISPRKVGLVAGLVRGRSVDDALVILEHTPKRAAKVIAKTIASAKANAVNNHNLKENDLQISALEVGPGTRLKRFRPVARGMAHSYMHRTTHIVVSVIGTERPARKPATKTSAAKPSTKTQAKGDK